MESKTTDLRSTSIEAAIATWTANRVYAEKVCGYINQGNCFEITRAQFSQWSGNSPESIHVYPTVFDGTMKFVMTDSKTDSQDVIDFDYVHIADYTYGTVKLNSNDIPTEGNITNTEALERSFRWMMNGNAWIAKAAPSTNGIFQAFHVPFTDLSELFGNEEIERLTVVIGLTTNGVADLILWNNVDDFYVPGVARDVSMPVPPFSTMMPESDFQLLMQS